MHIVIISIIIHRFKSNREGEASMNKNKTRSVKRGRARTVKRGIVLVCLTLPPICANSCTKDLLHFGLKGQLNESFRQHEIVANQSHADLNAKAITDSKALLRIRDEGYRELIGIIERRRIETNDNLDDQRKELRQLKRDFQAKPDSP